MSKISNFKKALISLIVIVLLLGFLIVNYTINYKTNDSVNISEVTINTKKVNSNNKVVTKKDVTKKEEEPEETNVISSFDSVRYTINYKLSSKDDIKSDAIIDVIISDEDAKYVSIKEINNDNITSKKTENGGLEILVKNVETNKDHSLVIEVDINNAPSEYKFSPKISVKSKNGEAIVKEPTVVEVSTTSLEGVLLNKDSGAEAPGVEIVLCRIDNDICVEKRSAITDQKGYYVIGDLKDGDYKVTLPEEYEFENNTIPITSGRNVVNISVENKGKFQASVKKYLEKVVVNGKEYNFDKKQKVQIPIITKSDVEATYLFEIKNDSRVDGYIKSIKENLPKEFVLSEDFEENKNWKENNGSYYNTTLKNDKITSGDTREVRIKIESKEKINPNQYINKVEIFGESYHTIKYIIDNNVYREFTISDDDKIDDLPYEKEGYTFEGWFIDKSYKNSYDFSKKVKSDLILYGKLKRNNSPKRTVTYMEDDTTVFDEKEVDDGECAEDIPGPEKEGYTFNYWKKDGVKYFNEITCEPVTEDIILYSDFDINKYKVKYYIPGELSDNNDHYNYTGAFNLYNDFTQEVEYKSFASNPGSVDIKYFNFKGWYKEESLTTKVEFPLEIKNATDIYGKYDIKKYNVEFYNDRGDTEPFLETTITATTIFNEPESEVPENYKIKEWQFENGDKVTYGDIAYNVLENRVVTEDDVIKVYRVLEGIKYKVRYIDYNNELIDENAEEILEFTESPEKLGDYAAIVSTPGHREGYVFDNFYYKNKAINEWDYTLFSDLCETKDNCVIDLIANYTEETEAPIYMVFFDKMNGASFETPKGEVFDKEKIPAYSGIGGPWTSIGSPSRYVPLGWYQVYTENGSPKSGPNGYLHYDTPFDFDNTVINETTFVTAEYKPYKYILRFNKTSDMQGEMPDQEIEFSSSNYSYNPYSTPQEKINVTINQNQFTYNGRYFTGWKSDITGDSIISSSPYSTFNVLQFEDDDHKIADGVYLLNLYPQFQEKSYYVEYNKNTGEGSMSSDSFTESDATGRTLKTNTFTKTGYKFSGWSLESGNNKEIVYSNEEPLNNVMNKMDELNTDYQTIYAQFVPNNYTIVFDKPEGVEGTMENQIMTYDISSNLSKNLYTKEGNEFKGWKNGNITYTDEQEVVNLTTEEEEIHLTPIFEPNKFTVTFIDKDEVYATITDVEYNSLINKPNPDPTKEHNKFLGWKVNGEENLFDFANTTVKSDLILVSVYEEIPTPSIIHTPTEWTNDKVTVTITGNDNYDILYKVDEGLYQDYNDSFDISENSTIKAKNVVKVNDETIAESAEVSHIIDNIDKENPSIGADSVVPNTTSVDFNVSLIDELSGIKNVKLVINVQDEEKEYCSLENEIVKSTVDGKITGPKQYYYSCNVDELSENTEYTGKLITTDVAGNRNEKNINFSTSDNDIVARIIAYDDTTLEEEDYINHPSLASALRDCETVSTTGYCEIQMVKSTRESVTVKNTQDIVLDLNGETVTGLNETTITNNGKLQIIDNNNSVDDETSEIIYEPIGKIINNHVYTQNIEGVDTLVNDGIAILNNENATLTIGNNEVSSEEEGAVVSKVEPYIEGSFRGVSTYSDNTTFNFYDGVIKGGSNPIYGMVNDTPFMHNVHNDSTSTVKTATLEILAEAVAKVKRTNTYFTSLNSAENATYDGAYTTDELLETESILDLGTNYRNYKYNFSKDTITEHYIKDLSGNNLDGIMIESEYNDGSVEFDATENNAIQINYLLKDYYPSYFTEVVQFDVAPNSEGKLEGTVYNGNKCGIIITNDYIVTGNNYKFDLPEDFRNGEIKRITYFSTNKIWIDGQEISSSYTNISSSVTTSGAEFIGRGFTGKIYNFKLSTFASSIDYSSFDLKDDDENLLLYYDMTNENNFTSFSSEKYASDIIKNNSNTNAGLIYKIDLSDKNNRHILNMNISVYGPSFTAGYVLLQEESSTYNEYYIPDNLTNVPCLYKTSVNQVNIPLSSILSPGKVYYLYFILNSKDRIKNRFIINSINLISDETNHNDLLRTDNSDQELVETTYTPKTYDYYDTVNNKHLEIYGNAKKYSNSIKFDNSSYGVITNGVDGITDEETIEIEFSTTVRWGWLYQGSNKEKISIYISSYDNLYVCMDNSGTTEFRLPSSYYDGNKHKFIITYNKNNKNSYKYKVYLDGTSITQSRWGSSKTLNNMDDNSYFGGDTVTKRSFANIYDFKIYNKEFNLTDTTIDYSNNLLLHYDFSNRVATNYDSITGLGNNYVASHNRYKIDTNTWASSKTLTINAMISSDGSANAVITDSSNNSKTNFMSIEGSKDFQDYSTTLQPNKIYYFDIRYTPPADGIDKLYDDVFIINSIKLDGEDLNVSDESYVNAKIKYLAGTPVLNSNLHSVFEDREDLPADTIQLIKPGILTTKFSVNETRDVILDLNGHDLTSQLSTYAIENNGKLKIIDSKYDINDENKSLKYIDNRSYSVICNSEDSYLEIDNVKINAYKGYAINNYGTLKLTNDTTIENSAAGVYGIFNRPKGKLLAGKASILQSDSISSGFGIYNESLNSDNVISGFTISGKNMNNIYTSESVNIIDSSLTSTASDKYSLNIYNNNKIITTDENTIINGIIHNSQSGSQSSNNYANETNTLIVNGSTIGGTINIKYNNKVIANGGTYTSINSEDSTIEYNDGILTGGVYSKNSLFTMKDGTINGTISLYGGVASLENGTLNITRRVSTSRTTGITVSGVDDVLNIKNNFKILDPLNDNTGIAVSSGNVHISDNVFIDCATSFSISSDGFVEVSDHTHIKGLITNKGEFNIGSKDDEFDSDYPLIENTFTYIRSDDNIDSLYSQYIKPFAINSGLCSGDTCKFTSGKLNFYSGTIIAKNNSVIAGPINSVREGYDIVINDTEDERHAMKLFNVETSDDYVAKIGDNYYKTIKDAYNSITTSNETTIIILKDIYSSVNLEISENKNIIMDLNGHVLNLYARNFIKNYGVFNLTDSTNEGRIISNVYNFIDNYNDFTLDASVTNNLVSNSNITNNDDAILNVTNNANISHLLPTTGINPTIAIKNQLDLYLNGGTINYSGIAPDSDIVEYGDGIINVSDGNIGSIYSSLAHGPNAIITVNSGTIDRLDCNYKCNVNQEQNKTTIINILYNYSYSKITDGFINTLHAGLNNNDNEFEKKSYLYIEDGSINTISSYALDNTSTYSVMLYFVGGSASNIDIEDWHNVITVNIGLPIKPAEVDSYYDEFNNRIYDDEVSTSIPVISRIYNYTSSSNILINNDGCTLNFYDGIIKTNISNVFKNSPTKIENGYALYSTSDENYSMIYYLKQINVAKINDTEYLTLDDAINSCGESECVIDIINNLYNPATRPTTLIPSNKNIKIILNGFIINSANSLFIQNNGKLTIDDLAPSNSVTANIENNGEMNISNLVSEQAKIVNNNTMNISSSTIRDSIFTTSSGSTTSIDTSTFPCKIVGSDTSCGNNDFYGNTNVTNSNLGSWTRIYEGAIVKLSNSSGSQFNNYGSVTFDNSSSINYLENNNYAYIADANLTYKLITKNNSTTYYVKGTLKGDIENNGTFTAGLPIKPSNIDSYKDEHNNNIYDDSMKSDELLLLIGEFKSYGTFNFYDGNVYSNDYEWTNNSVDNIEKGYNLLINENEKYDKTTYDFHKYLSIDDIAQVGDETFNNLKDAFDYCSTNCSVTLLKSIYLPNDYDDIIIPSTYNITFDLNGQSIINFKENLFTNNGTLNLIDNAEEKGLITIKSLNFIDNKGILNTSDISFYRKYNGYGVSNTNFNIIKNAGTLNLNSGTFIKSRIYNDEHSNSSSNDYYLINSTESSTLNVNDITTEINDSRGSTYFKHAIESTSSTVNIIGGTIGGFVTLDSSDIIVSGGTLNSMLRAISSNLTINDGNFNSVIMESNGTSTISGGNFNSSSLSNSGTLTITGGNFHSYNIGNGKTLNVDGLILNDNSYISNSGDAYLSNVSISNVDIGIYNITGNLYLNDNVYINANDIGIKNGRTEANINDCPIVIFGDTANAYDDSNPIVIGANIGVYNIYHGYIKFYNGSIISLVDPISNSNNVTNENVVRNNYKISVYDDIEEYEGYKVARLTYDANVEQVYILNGNNYQTVQTAIDDALPNTVNVLELYQPISLTSNITVPDNVTINVITNGNNIDLNGYSFVAVSDQNSIKIYKDSNESDSLLGEILGLFNIGNNSPLKNIAIFNDDNGNTLNSSYEYTLKYNVNGVYEDIDVVEDTLGNYVIATSQSDDKIKTIDGNVYIKNITPGTYSLVSDTGKTSTFTILENGNITGPARITYIDNSKQKGNVLATSNADLIIGLQTGNKVINYGIIILSITILLKVLLTIRKRMN